VLVDSYHAPHSARLSNAVDSCTGVPDAWLSEILIGRRMPFRTPCIVEERSEIRELAQRLTACGTKYQQTYLCVIFLVESSLPTNVPFPAVMSASSKIQSSVRPGRARLVHVWRASVIMNTTIGPLIDLSPARSPREHDCDSREDSQTCHVLSKYWKTESRRVSLETRSTAVAMLRSKKYKQVLACNEQCTSRWP
jgi:hypothetical protein